MAGLFGSKVYMFDPSPSVVAHSGQPSWDRACGRGHLYFQAIGVGNVTSPDGLTLEGKKYPAKTVSDIARSLNHPRVDVLKIDIEGGEFAVLEQLLDTQTLATLQVQHLLVEFHLWDDRAFVEFVGIISRLKQQGYVIFRKELNPSEIKAAEYAFLKIRPETPAALPHSE
jgi:FkbM family methyltransferase